MTKTRTEPKAVAPNGSGALPTDIQIEARMAGPKLLSVKATHIPSGKTVEICGADQVATVRAAMVSLSEATGMCGECGGVKTDVEHGHLYRCSFFPKPFSSKGTLARSEGWVTARPQDGSLPFEYEIRIGSAGISIGKKAFSWDELYEAAMRAGCEAS